MLVGGAPRKEPVAKKTAKKTSPMKKSPSPLKKSAKKTATPKIVEPQVETPAQVYPPKKLEKSPAPVFSKKVVKSPANVSAKSPAKRGRGRLKYKSNFSCRKKITELKYSVTFFKHWNNKVLSTSTGINKISKTQKLQNFNKLLFQLLKKVKEYLCSGW